MTDSPKFTKGRWVADVRVGCVAVHPDNTAQFNCLSGAEKQCIFYKHGYQTTNPDGSFKEWNVNEEDVANAHLIVAAPEMYEVLRGLVNDPEHFSLLPPHWKQAIIKALAKAAGKEPTT